MHHKKLLDFERPRLDHAFYQENNKPHAFGMDQGDGLPKPVVMSTITETEAADLKPERFVCMAAEGRPQCAHYKRQLLPSPHDKERVICTRYCTALKDEEGEMFSVNDQEVIACEFRDPADPESAKKLEVFDAEIIRRQAERDQEEKVFDPLEELK